MTEQPLSERILTVLGEAKTPMTPQEIAHLVGFLKPTNQASRVNPTLYVLWEAEKIERHTIDGRKPKYSIVLK